MKFVKSEIHTVKEIGSILKKFRKEQGITQIQLSQIANVGNRFIIELEQGKPTIQIDKALYVLNRIGIKVSLEYFILEDNCEVKDDQRNLNQNTKINQE